MKSKLILFNHGRRHHRRGFSLVEATFSIGVLSFGFLSLAPLLALSLKTARLARDDRGTAQIAATLTEEGRQGTLTSGTTYLDIQGTAVGSASMAAYWAQSTLQTGVSNGSLTQLTLTVTPLGAPDRTRTYAVVYPTPLPTAP